MVGRSGLRVSVSINRRHAVGRGSGRSQACGRERLRCLWHWHGAAHQFNRTGPDRPDIRPLVAHQTSVQGRLKNRAAPYGAVIGEGPAAPWPALMPTSLPFSCWQTRINELLSADKRSAFHGIFAPGHRSPATFLDQIAPIVTLGLFQRGKLDGRIGPTLETMNTICRCQLCAGPGSCVRCHFCCSPAGHPSTPGEAEHHGSNDATRARPEPAPLGWSVILPASPKARTNCHFHLPAGSGQREMLADV